MSTVEFEADPYTTRMGHLPKSLIQLLNCDPQTGLCNKGWNDVTLALIFASAFLLVRTYLYTTIFPPLAKRWKVLPGRIHLMKFSEQAWLLFCHTLALTVGVGLLIGRPYGSAFWGNSEGMHHFWIDYPVAHKRLDPAFKLYYFGVLGYWLHHCAGLVIEGYQRLSVERARSQGRKQQAKVPKRSDYGALAVHHVVTVSLVALSYYMHFTRIGHVTMVLLDVADILLPLAKILKYTGKQTICDVAFAIFTLSWIATRHYFLLLLCYSIYKDPFTYIPEKYRSWDPNGTESFYSMNVYYVFNTLFAALQILLIYWLAMVIKVVVKVVQGGKAEDVRSDDEDEESELTEVDDAMTEKSIKRKAGNSSPNQRPASGVELRNGDWGTVKESSVRSRRRH